MSTVLWAWSRTILWLYYVSGCVCVYVMASTYFSLSTRAGHMMGSSFEAQSSSLKRSEVADNAKRAAFRACTKGSRRDLAKAAARTLARD